MSVALVVVWVLVVLLIFPFDLGGIALVHLLPQTESAELWWRLRLWTWRVKPKTKRANSAKTHKRWTWRLVLAVMRSVEISAECMALVGLGDAMESALTASTVNVLGALTNCVFPRISLSCYPSDEWGVKARLAVRVRFCLWDLVRAVFRYLRHLHRRRYGAYFE